MVSSVLLTLQSMLASCKVSRNVETLEMMHDLTPDSVYHPLSEKGTSTG